MLLQVPCSILLRCQSIVYEEVYYYVPFLFLQAHSLDASKGTPGEEATCTEEVVQQKEVREQEQQGQEEQQVATKQEPTQPTSLDTEMVERVSPTSSVIFRPFPSQYSEGVTFLTHVRACTPLTSLLVFCRKLVWCKP